MYHRLWGKKLRLPPHRFCNSTLHVRTINKMLVLKLLSERLKTSMQAILFVDSTGLLKTSRNICECFIFPFSLCSLFCSTFSIDLYSYHLRYLASEARFVKAPSCEF